MTSSESESKRSYDRKFFNNKSYYQNYEQNSNRRNFNSYRTFHKTNNAYHNNLQRRIERQSRIEVIKVKRETSNEQNSMSKQKSDKRDRETDRRFFENDRHRRFFEKNRQKQNDNNKQKKNRYDRYDKKNRYNEKFKAKAYLTHDENQNTDNESTNNDCENYHQSQNLTYFDSDYDFEKEFEATVLNIVAVNHFDCRRCAFVCSSNNQFHKHLRSATCIKFFSKSNINFQKVVLTRLSSNAMTYSDDVEESNSQIENNIFLIRFKINSNTEAGKHDPPVRGVGYEPVPSRRSIW